jgi:hypothetical protein
MQLSEADYAATVGASRVVKKKHVVVEFLTEFTPWDFKAFYGV